MPPVDDAPPAEASSEPGDGLVVVGIGASAGGLEAIESFFDRIPTDTGAAFVVVQHVSSDFESLMDEFLARHTELPIHPLERDTPIEPDAIYLNPPGRNVTLQRGRLVLSDPVEGRAPSYPIDVFLRSLANDRKDAAVAIVFSGTGTDGTHGIQAIKREGGVVLVQTPESAGFDGMPRSAIATGVVDLVLPPGELAEKVTAYLRPEPLESLRAGEDESSDVVTAILELLTRETSVDFRRYKRRALERRIGRRMRLHRLDEPERYLELLRESGAELNLLGRDVLINVTMFFRDPEAFEAVKEIALPRIVERADPEGLIRAWVIGCSTGEEAYSLAMMFEESLGERKLALRYKVFATDLDREAVARASEGRYSRNIEADLTPERLERFFVERGDVYQVSRSVRENVLFAVHDLVSDPPFTRMQFVSCRNLLIYLQSELQNKALALMHFASANEGILFLGRSESPGDLSSEFTTLSSRWKIYEKRRHVRLRLPATTRLHEPADTERMVVGRRGKSVAEPANEEAAYMRICEAIASSSSEAALVVDEGLELMHVFGPAGAYLETPKGKVSYDLSASLHSHLRDPVTTAIRRAAKTNLPITFTAPTVDGETESTTTLRVRVLPVKDEQSNLVYYVLMFGEGVPGLEETETVNEKLQATNEELLASNEELQATNEELHAVNEELYTVNSEHQSRIQELTELDDEMENLLESTDIGTVFLDDQFRIRKFTPAARQAIALIASDIGRPFSDLSHKLKDASLMDDVAHVLRTGEAMEKDVENDLNTHLLMRIHPYRTEREKVCGVVLTFVDITDIQRTQRALEESERRLRAITENARDVYWIVNSDTLEIQYVSRAYERVWGQSIENLYLDRTQWVNAIHPDDRQRMLERYRQGVASGAYDVEYRVVRPDGEVRWVRDRVFRPREGESGVRRTGVAEDVTERHRADQGAQTSTTLFESVFDGVNVGMALLSRDGQILRANAALNALLGYDDEETVTGKDFVDLASGSDRSTLTSAIREGFSGSPELEIRFMTRGGGQMFALVSGSRVDGVGEKQFVCQIRDVTQRHHRDEQVRELTTNLETAANHDPLTELLNRRGLVKALRSGLNASRRSGGRMAAILVDCDDFKSVNDRYGHTAGDIVLREIAHRVASTLRPSDWTARIGGDEFLVLLPDTRVAEALHVAEKLRRAIAATPVDVLESVVPVTVSIGVATLPGDATTIEEIMAGTREALARSKESGKNVVRADDVECREGGDGPESATNVLMSLSRGRGLYALAQPIWNLKESRIVGYEMLSRGPAGPLEKPQDFFRLSMEKQVLTPIDLRCLESSLEAARGLESPERVHINMFPSTISLTPTERIVELIELNPIQARLCLELSEQQFVGDPYAFVAPLSALRKCGIDIAIDDVGFGRSSLETLIVLEPDVFKVDHTMIQGIADDAGRRRSLQRLLQVARSLDARVIAEGVQVPEDKQVLLDLDVEMGQGFLWGHPYAPN